MAELLQVVKGTSATVTVTFELNGVGQNLDSGVPVVTLTYEPSETGRGGFQRFTGIRDVDRWLNRHRAVAAVA